MPFVLLRFFVLLCGLLLHRGAIAQSFEAAGGHLLVSRNTIFHLNEIAFGLAGLDQTLFGVAILNHEHATDARFRLAAVVALAAIAAGLVGGWTNALAIG